MRLSDNAMPRTTIHEVIKGHAPAGVMDFDISAQ